MFVCVCVCVRVWMAVRWTLFLTSHSHTRAGVGALKPSCQLLTRRSSIRTLDRYFLTLVDFDGANPRIAFDVEIYKHMKFDKVTNRRLSALRKFLSGGMATSLRHQRSELACHHHVPSTLCSPPSGGIATCDQHSPTYPLTHRFVEQAVAFTLVVH